MHVSSDSSQYYETHFYWPYQSFDLPFSTNLQSSIHCVLEPLCPAQAKLRKLYQKLMSKHTSGENTLGRFLLIAWHTLLECTRPLLASRLATQHLFRMASHKNTLHSDSTQDFHKRLQGSKTTEPYKPVFYKLLRITYYRGYISPISVVGVRLGLKLSSRFSTLSANVIYA